MGDEMDDDAKLTDRSHAPGLSICRNIVCHHSKMTVHRNKRKIICDGCGAELDPVDVLAKIAHNNERVSSFAGSANLAHKRLQEIERRERNAKARLKRLGVDLPPKYDLSEEINGKLAAYVDDGCVCITTAGFSGPLTKRFTPDEAQAVGEKIQRLAWQARNGVDRER